MITNQEMALLRTWQQHVQVGASVPRNVTQRLLDILRREGGSMTREQFDEAARQGFNVEGIKTKV